MKTIIFNNGKERLKRIKSKLLKNGFILITDYRTKTEKCFYFQKDKVNLFLTFDFITNELRVTSY